MLKTCIHSVAISCQCRIRHNPFWKGDSSSYLLLAKRTWYFNSHFCQVSSEVNFCVLWRVILVNCTTMYIGFSDEDKCRFHHWIIISKFQPRPVRFIAVMYTDKSLAEYLWTCEYLCLVITVHITEWPTCTVILQIVIQWLFISTCIKSRMM